MRPPQRTRAPVLSSSTASRGVIWLNSPCSGCGTVLQAASSTLARQAAANGRKFMLISPERGRKRRGSGTVFAQCPDQFRSEEHTSELQSLMRISYAVFCLKKKKDTLDSPYI